MTTTSLPDDCVADVSDGVETMQAVIKHCGPVGPEGPQGLPGAVGPSLVVRDANNALVGLVSGTDVTQYPGFALQIVRQVAGQAVEFIVTEAGFPQRQDWTLNFTDVNCMGTPLFEITSATGPLTAKALVVYGDVAYYPVGAVVPGLAPASRFIALNYTPASCATDGGTFVPPEGCCVGPGSGEFVPGAAVDLTTFGLVPPFHAEGP